MLHSAFHWFSTATIMHFLLTCAAGHIFRKCQRRSNLADQRVSARESSLLDPNRHKHKVKSHPTVCIWEMSITELLLSTLLNFPVLLAFSKTISFLHTSVRLSKLYSQHLEEKKSKDCPWAVNLLPEMSLAQGKSFACYPKGNVGKPGKRTQSDNWEKNPKSWKTKNDCFLNSTPEAKK